MNMNMRHILLKSLSDYRRNLKFIIPHAIEYFLDVIIFLVMAVFLMGAIGAFLPSIVTKDFELLYSQIPFYIVVVVIFGFLLLFAVIILLNAAVRTAIIGMAKQSYEAESTTLSIGLESIRKYGLEVFAYVLLLIGAVVTLIFLGFLPLGLLNTNTGITAVFALLSATLSCLLLYFFTLFTPQQIVVKEKEVIEAIKGSFSFVSMNIVPVLMYGIIAVGSIIFIGVVSMVFFSLISFLKYNLMGKVVAGIFQHLLMVLIGLVIAPYFEIVKTYMIMEKNI